VNLNATEILGLRQQVLEGIPPNISMSKSRHAGMLLNSRLKMHHVQMTVRLNRAVALKGHSP